ncbi:MAG: glycosyltransferase [Actinomycetota bacterium]|nr:glycosyltransferase [Actinomycetota bacterium]
MTVGPAVSANPAESAEVAVVVPTKNSARTLRACLEALRSQSVTCEIVVVDNFSTDETPQIAEELADIVIATGPERSAQRNAGARATTASIVGFVDSDMIPAPEVVAQAVVAIRAGATAVIVPERTVGIGYWARVRAFERSFYDGSDDIEAARFFSRAAFDAAGGFDEQLTGAEDWDLSDRIRAVGPLVRIEAAICHDEGDVRYLDACRKKAHYAPGLRRYGATRGAASLGRKLAARPWLRQPVRVLGSQLGPGLLALKAGEAVSVLWVLATTCPDRRSATSPIVADDT